MSSLTSAIKLQSGASLVSAFNEVAILSETLEKIDGTGEQDIAFKSAIMTYQGICRDLQKVNASNWLSIGKGAGITVYGTVALSWCKDAQIVQVWEGWMASKFPLLPLPKYERPARFINPALLPATDSLAEIIAFCPDVSLPICTLLAALKEPLVFDLPSDQLKNANPQIASFLKSRMEQLVERTPEHDDLIQTLEQTVKGTKWEV